MSSPLASCLYVGSVRHRRRSPVIHSFRYGLFLAYLDLAELDRVFRGHWLWSTRRPAPAWFRRADHLGDPRIPLDEAVRDLVRSRLGFRPEGPVRLLTHLRYLGVCFNPVSLFFCHQRAGEPPAAVVAEVWNTPWRERHCYILDGRGNASGLALRARHPKEFHVSPFLGMDAEYCWRIRGPGRRLAVHLEHRAGGETILDATLTLRRREITGRNLSAALLRHPWMTGQVLGGIYLQALRLWRKGAPFHPHPRRRPSTAARSPS